MHKPYSGLLLGFLFVSLPTTLSFKETVFGDLELKYASLFNFSPQITYTPQLHGILSF